MIERLVAFALNQRFITLAFALVLTAAGIVSYHRLPIEAYPDVGDVKVEVITLWPGHAAEEVERLISIPLENELNGIADMTFLRLDTLFGLSNIKVLFAEEPDAAHRHRVLALRDVAAAGVRGHAIRLGVLGRDHADDVVQGIVLMRKGENPGRVIGALKIALRSGRGTESEPPPAAPEPAA